MSKMTKRKHIKSTGFKKASPEEVEEEFQQSQGGFRVILRDSNGKIKQDETHVRLRGKGVKKYRDVFKE